MLTPDDHKEWAEYWNMTLFAQPGLRYGLAGVVSMLANVNRTDKNQQLVKPADVVLPPPVKSAEELEREKAAHQEQMIGRLFEMTRPVKR